jgi:hypothetical protein
MAPNSQRDLRPDSQRQLFAWTLLACIVLLGLMAAPFYLGRIYTSDDLWAFHLPVRHFYAQCLAAGDAFDWMPSLYSGFYLTGEGQAGTYHPLHWLLYKFLPLHAAFDLELLLSYPFLLAGTYLFFRRHVRRRDAALVGAMVFTFSGFNLLHFVHPNAIAVIAHLPWLLLAIHIACHERRRGRVITAEAAVALLTASQLLLGYPQYVWFSLLTEAAYLLYLRRHVAFSFAVRFGVLKLLGSLVGAVQLLPTIDALAESERRLADSAFAHQGGLHVLNVLQWIAPYLFRDRVVGGNTHEFGIYTGAATVALLLWLICRWPRLRHRRFAAAALGFGALALLLALGQSGLLYTLQTLLPVIGKFRLPARYIVLVHLAMAALSAVAFAELVRQQRGQTPEVTTQGPMTYRRWAFDLCFLSLVLALLAGWIWRDYVAPLPLRFIGPLLLAAAFALVWLAERGRRFALVGLVLFIAADLGAYGFSYAIYPNSFAPATALSTLPDVPADGSARIATELREPGVPSLRYGNQLVLKGWRQLDGYAGLEPARALDYRTLPALRAAGVRFVCRSASTEKIAGLRPIPGDPRWLEVPDPLPRARCVKGDRAPNLVSDRPGQIEVRVHPCWLAVSERYHSGWKAEIDGRPSEVFRSNGEFLGCVISGEHEREHHVKLTFAPASLRYGKWLSLTGLILLAAWCLVHGVAVNYSRGPHTQ